MLTALATSSAVVGYLVMYISDTGDTTLHTLILTLQIPTYVLVPEIEKNEFVDTDG